MTLDSVNISQKTGLVLWSMQTCSTNHKTPICYCENAQLNAFDMNNENSNVHA